MPKKAAPLLTEKGSHFVQLLIEYMWRQRPPITTAAELARHVKMDRQTIWQWMHRGVMPQLGTLAIFIRRSNMNPAEANELSQAAGYGGDY